MHMKRILFGVGAVCAAIGLLAAVKHHRNRNTRPQDCVDGGVRHYQSGEDAPKVITSTEITEFRCEFSLYADAEPGALGNGKYFCSAVSDGDGVLCSFRRRNRTGQEDERTFTADRSFMEQLQALISAHNLSQHNGYSYSVSGLPDMYGAMLDVRYASGESIYAYNNQDVFLAYEALEDLFVLFSSWDGHLCKACACGTGNTGRFCTACGSPRA